MHPVPDTQHRTPTILVVEDEPLILMALSDFLQDCGFNLLQAGNAAEAVQILENSDSQVDLVFSDVRMPGALDGFGLARWIRENRPKMPLILTSGDTKETEAVRELCGGAPFVAKPYDLTVVAAQIRRIIASRAESLV